MTRENLTGSFLSAGGGGGIRGANPPPPPPLWLQMWVFFGLLARFSERSVGHVRRGESSIFIWGGGAQKIICANAHYIRARNPKSLSAALGVCNAL